MPKILSIFGILWIFAGSFFLENSVNFVSSTYKITRSGNYHFYRKIYIIFTPRLIPPKPQTWYLFPTLKKKFFFSKFFNFLFGLNVISGFLKITSYACGDGGGH